ncbi:sigma factor-like helix-turn-helix DNA-binding protein [Paenibacillus cisolokensis]|uniref:sigma factor-like helix-turn-helix DNA-binding protein n=1 Tax=Paenibacillus cisolokensis TaxID=1658519 RepID=UPI003D2A6F83
MIKVGESRKPKMPELDERGYLANMRDLKLAYRQTYWQLRRALKACGDDGPDAPILRSAISDVNYAIMWLHTGRRPGNKRGIERRAAYQREKLVDPLKMQAYMSPARAVSPTTLTDDERFRLEEALRRLSDRERECYELKHGQGFSHAYIAQLLGMTKASVDEYVQRAQRKVTAELEQNLFLLTTD